MPLHGPLFGVEKNVCRFSVSNSFSFAFFFPQRVFYFSTAVLLKNFLTYELIFEVMSRIVPLMALSYFSISSTLRIEARTVA